ncbi:hypothetical protein DM02DRAFT_704906 [Periconia macrospinosa]|uniref:Uncharacterized protein n=1 Tax=Periconia macrospinosa TaxID=97972 RepID=A0A2V1DTJ6_9PLEO|nr:hypothetical protein DM02DRAFT_704906 [Periconia macrospinosa]
MHDISLGCYIFPPATSSVTRQPNQLTSQAEAEAIHKNDGKAVQSVGNGGRQIGPGLYILNSFQGWGDNDPKGDVRWDCVVTVDADEWDKWNKVYLPELFTFPEDAEKKKDTCKPLELWKMFPTSRKNRLRFIGYVSPGATIEDTVLFSKVKDYLHMTQGLLPPALIDTGKVHLAQCAERGTEANKKIGKMGAADWGFVESLPGYGMGAYN